MSIFNSYVSLPEGNHPITKTSLIVVLQKIEDDWNIRLASQEFTRDGKIPKFNDEVMKCRSGKCLNPIPFYPLVNWQKTMENHHVQWENPL